MRKSDSSTATALVESKPNCIVRKIIANTSGNYDEYFVLQYELPAGELLKTDYTHLEFDVFYDVTGDNRRSVLELILMCCKVRHFLKHRPA